MLKYIFTAMLAFGFLTTQHTHEVCEGYWPENDLYIPASEVSALALNEAQFNSVLDRVERVYKPIISRLGGRLEINRKWSDGTVNASAMRIGSRYQVNMYGGLARYHNITEEAFALVACHEVGHHLAGAPKLNSWFGSWASNEGQSDYFSGLKCFRQLYSEQENIDWAETAEIHEIVLDKCSQVWASDADQALCARFAMAGKEITTMFKELKFPNQELGFDTPDASKVSRMDDGHPRPQCRLDTYLASALCDRPLNERLSDSDPDQGACTRSEGYTLSVRPLCWYKPN